MSFGFFTHHGDNCKQRPNYIYSDPPKSNHWLIIFPNGKSEVILNLSRFCRENKLTQSTMIRTANGEFKHYKGYICKRCDEDEIIVDYSIETKCPHCNSVVHGTDAILNHGNNCKKNPLNVKARPEGKPRKITFPDGKIVIVTNVKLFCEENNLTYNSIIATLCGTQKSHKGFLCENM